MLEGASSSLYSSRVKRCMESKGTDIVMLQRQKHGKLVCIFGSEELNKKHVYYAEHVWYNLTKTAETWEEDPVITGLYTVIKTVTLNCKTAYPTGQDCNKQITFPNNISK